MKIKIEKHNDEYFVPIPTELLEELGWDDGDDVSVETTLDCYDTGEVTSIIIANISKSEGLLK